MRRRLRLGESVLAKAADGAHPVLGNVFPGSAGRDAGIGIAYLGVIHVTAGAFVLHVHVLLFYWLMIQAVIRSIHPQ